MSEKAIVVSKRLAPVKAFTDKDGALYGFVAISVNDSGVIVANGTGAAPAPAAESKSHQKAAPAPCEAKR